MTDPEYQTLMKEMVYDRPRFDLQCQRVWRSMITEWDFTSLNQRDDLDHLDRPPSPPTSPRASFMTNVGGVADRDLIPTLPMFSSPFPIFSSSSSSENISRKRYRPSSPEMKQWELQQHNNVRTDSISESKPPKRYRPSSPEMMFSSLSSDQVASYIPIPTEPPMFPPQQQNNNFDMLLQELSKVVSL